MSLYRELGPVQYQECGLIWSRVYSTATKCRKPFDQDCMVDWFDFVIIKFHLDVTVNPALNLKSLTFVMISLESLESFLLYHTE